METKTEEIQELKTNDEHIEGVDSTTCPVDSGKKVNDKSIENYKNIEGQIKGQENNLSRLQKVLLGLPDA